MPSRIHTPGLFLSILAVCLLAGPLAAQSVRTLVPDAYRLTAGRSLLLSIEAGPPDARGVRSWPAERISWLFVRVAGTQENVQEVASNATAKDSAPEFRLEVKHAGIALVGADLKPRIVAIDAAKLERFLNERVAANPRANEKAPEEAGEVRVRRIESMKLLVQALDENGQLRNSADAQSKSGQQAEIRPLADPTAVGLDRDLPVRVYLPGASEKTVRVIATHLESGRQHRFHTGPGGTGHFIIDAAGAWVVEASAARRLSGDPEADFELATATLRFEVPPLVQPEEDGR